jgi:hypothetical protein
VLDRDRHATERGEGVFIENFRRVAIFLANSAVTVRIDLDACTREEPINPQALTYLLMGIDTKCYTTQ